MKAMVEATGDMMRRYGRQSLPLVGMLLFVACARLPLQGPVTDVDGEVSSTSGAASGAASGAEVARNESESVTTASDTVAVDYPGPVPVPEPSAAPDTVPEPALPLATLQPLAMAVPVSVHQPQAAPSSFEPGTELQVAVDALCDQIGGKLGSVSIEDCYKHAFRSGGGNSVNGRPLVIKDVLPKVASTPDFKVLIMGGIHGDEYSSISILFKWMDQFAADGLEGEFHWRFVPLVNPDGLLDGDKAKRQNANGVDLNRNFPSQDWNATAVAYWQESTGSNPRRFPGSEAGSEPEVQWLVSQIEAFQPDVIVSLHAPYHLLDFDGPAAAPDRIGELYLHQLGVYPGSLGNYAGLNKRIPVVTLELPSAGIMPPAEQINLMWRDLVGWLDREGRRTLDSSPVAGAAAAGTSGAAAP